MEEKETLRENFLLDKETAELFRTLAAAENISRTDLFRKMIQAEAEEQKELLQTWAKLQELRPK